jgi:hypothetical protein
MVLLHANALIDYLQYISTNSRKQRLKCDDNTLIYLIMLGYETVQIYILLCLNDKINDKLMTLQVHGTFSFDYVEFNHYKI